MDEPESPRYCSPHIEAQVYPLRNSAQHRVLMSRRSAAEHADFLLPHLRPGMRVLDCGCGPGSISVGLAAVVSPGEVTGVDLVAADIEAARALALEQRVINAHFEIADVFDLPFSDGSFDAAFAHALLQHVQEPVRALKEIRRVLKAGGVLGVSDTDYGTVLHEPSTPHLEMFHMLLRRAMEWHGGSPYCARHQRRMLAEAGFARSEAYACVRGRGSGALEKTRYAAGYFQLLLRDLVRTAAIEQKWVDEETLDMIDSELERWGNRSDAFYSVVTCQALGWVEQEPNPMHRVRNDPEQLRRIAELLSRRGESSGDPCLGGHRKPHQPETISA